MESLGDYFATKGTAGALAFVTTLYFNFKKIKGKFSILFTLSPIQTMFELLDIVCELLSVVIMS